MLHGYDLATPWALLLLPLPFLVALWRRHGTGSAAGLRISAALRERLAGDETAIRPPSKTAILRWIAWVLLVVALSDPRKVAATPALPATGRDIMFTLDLSGSMVAQDMLAGGKPITRIALLKKVGTELIRRRQGDRVGLVIFAEHALAAAPLSFDADGVARVLNQTDIGLVGRSTAMGDGLGLAVKRLSESKAPTRIIILLSDGSNNAGSMDPAGVAALAHKLGIRIYTIGFGPNETTTPEDDPDSVDYGALQKYAKIGGGEAFRVRNGEDFADAGRKIEALIAGETMAPPAVIRDDLWPWPAALAMASAFAMGCDAAAAPMIALGHIALLRPLWLLVLLPLALLLLLSRPRGGHLAGWEKASDPHLLAAMVGRGATAGGSFRAPAVLATVVIGIVALAGPAVQRASQERLRNLDATVILVDVSQDMASGGAIRQAASAAHDLLLRTSARQAGLIVYAGDAYVASALTDYTGGIDADLFALDDATVPDPGARPDRALALAHKMLEEAHIIAGDVILISSGGGLEGAAADRQAQALAAAGHRVYAMAVSAGARRTAALNRVAAAGDGFAVDIGHPERLYAVLADEAIARTANSAVRSLDWRDLGRYLLFLAALPLLFGFRKAVTA